MRSRLFIPLLLAALTALAPATARAWTWGDTLTVIQRPLPNLPVLARPGDTFPVWALAGSGTTGWRASLRYGALAVPLAPAGGGWQPAKGRWELAFAVPPGTPEELYALVLASDSTTADTARHAVKVLPAYRSDYCFAQVTDTHLPTHAFSVAGVIDAADTSGMADFDAVIEDLNVIHPEFVLHTGDLVNEGELEDYLGMYEMGRAQAMLERLEAPVWLAAGNHDLGGWQPTAPSDGTSRRNWWRTFGWKWLENPPPGDPQHSQDFTFDYGPLHVIGLEAYINSGSYDHFRQDLWGAQSFTAEQLAWLRADLAAQPAGTHSLLASHFDFGGTLADGSPGPALSQIDPASLGIDGDIWGHQHGMPDDTHTPRGARPFDLGCQSVIDLRAFRIFRVHDGVISPGPIHRAGGSSGPSSESLAVAWSGPNDGTRSRLRVTLINRYGEAWDHARLKFNLADHDSSFSVTNGTIVQVIRQGGIAVVSVECVLPAVMSLIVTVQAIAPVAGVGAPPVAACAFAAPGPNPFAPGAGGVVRLRFVLPAPAPVRLEVVDVSGRRIATLGAGTYGQGEHTATWDGRGDDGTLARPGLYLVRFTAHGQALTRRLTLTR